MCVFARVTAMQVPAEARGQPYLSFPGAVHLLSGDSSFTGFALGDLPSAWPAPPGIALSLLPQPCVYKRAAIPGFVCGSMRTKVGSCVCVASTLINEPSLQPLFILLTESCYLAQASLTFRIFLLYPLEGLALRHSPQLATGHVLLVIWFCLRSHKDVCLSYCGGPAE